MKKYVFSLVFLLTSVGSTFALIDIGIFSPGTYGLNPDEAKMEIAINPQSLYAFPPAAAEFNLILFAPTSDLTGTEVFSVVEDNVNNGSMSWDDSQTFASNGNTYFVFSYSGTGINLSAYGNGSFVLALTIGVTGGSGLTNFSIADESSGIFTDFGIRSSLNLLGVNQLAAISSPGILNNVALPLELIRFDAKKNKSQVELEWEVANEVGVDKYEIERSSEVNIFTTIGAVTSLNELHNIYRFVDSEISSIGNHYYRLKMIDLDGSFSYSKLIPITFDTDSPISIFPNPANNTLTIKYSELEIGRFFNIEDTSGKSIYSGKLDDSGRLFLNTSSWGNGVYTFSVWRNVNEKNALKVIVSH